MSSFKIGDRVRLKGSHEIIQEGDVGTVKRIYEECVSVEWDNLINGHNGMGLYEGRKGHCWSVYKWGLELVPTEDKQVREVKRKAKVGEWVKIIKSEDDRVKNGEIVEVSGIHDDRQIWVWHENGFGSQNKDCVRYELGAGQSEYVVLENYTPPVKTYTPPVKTYTQTEVDELIKQTKADILAKIKELFMRTSYE